MLNIVATLEGLLDELIETVRTVSGIAFVPDDPPARLASHPAGVVWLTGGTSVIGPPGVATYHHDVRIGLLTAIENTAVANQRILPQIEPVIEAIWDRVGGVAGFRQLSEHRGLSRTRMGRFSGPTSGTSARSSTWKK